MQDATTKADCSYADDLYCPECGYSLRGLTSERCPECGLSLAEVVALGTNIPWAHRRALGAWRAYWRTVGRATFRSKRLFGVVPARVDYAAAQRFRWTTISTFWLTALLVYAAYCATNSDLRQELAINGWFHAVLWVAGFLTLGALSGLPSYLFCPRHLTIDEQNRAIAMSYYACAPLAALSWTLPLYALATLFALVKHVAFDQPPWLASLVTAFVVFLRWLRLVRLGRVVFRHRWATARVALLVPILWGLGVALVGVGLPWLVLYAVSLVYALF
jgi:hypothetical protein